MSKILDFFTGGWVRWAVLALVLALGLLFLRTHWVQIGREQVLVENAQAAVKIVVQQGKATERVVTKYVKVVGETKVVTNTIEKEVTKYAETNAGLCLDPEWRRLHDSAALNTVPGAAKSTDGTSGAPTAAEALETVTQNYGIANRAIDKLNALQEWVREQTRVK